MKIDPQQRRLQDAIDDEDDARWELRIAKLMLAASIIGTVLVITTWVLLIRWGLQGMGEPGVQKGGHMFFGTIGMLLLSAASAAADLFSAEHWHKRRRLFIKAKRRTRNITLGVS